MAANVVPTRGALRVLRACVMAITSAALTVAAHTAAGGPAPDPALTAALAVLLAGAGIGLADRRRGALGILAILGGAQLGTHLLLEALSTHRHAAGAGIQIDSVLMTSAHVTAALVTGLLLAHAESAVFAAAAALGMLLPRRPTPLPVLAAPAGPVLPVDAGQLVLDVLMRRVHARRGPPNSS